MTRAWIPLATTTLSSAVSSVTFASIPSGYRDLILVSDLTTSASSSNIQVEANGVSSGYSAVIAFNTSSQTPSVSGFYHGYTESAERCTSIMQIQDYSATDKHKTALNRHGTIGSSYVIMAASRYASTDAITSLRIFNQFGVNFAIGSTFSLWGSNRL